VFAFFFIGNTFANDNPAICAISESEYLSFISSKTCNILSSNYELWIMNEELLLIRTLK